MLCHSCLKQSGIGTASISRTHRSFQKPRLIEDERVANGSKCIGDGISLRNAAASCHASNNATEMLDSQQQGAWLR